MEAVKKFYQEVNKSSKKEMVFFLANHFRYNTMNSWNALSSYANCVKINRVIPNKLMNKAYELLNLEDSFFDINDLIDDFGINHDYKYQAGFNGSSRGYVVMYEGERKLSEHKSICTNCGQRNFKTVEETGNCKCGKCGEEKRINKVMYEVHNYPGRSIDQNEDFSEWSIDSLKERVELVQDFDMLCDDIVASFINLCENYNIEEETILVPKKVKKLVEVE
jgi:hypothetical protein